MTDVEQQRQRARDLAGQGRFRDAVAAGQAIAQSAPDAAFQCDLRNWRHEAFYEGAHTTGRPDWPPRLSDLWPEHVDRIPEVHASQLSAEVVGAAIQKHGSLIVRGLLTEAFAAELLSAVDAAYAARANGEGGAFYTPFETSRDPDLPAARAFSGDTSMLTADSPKMLARWLDVLRDTGVLGAVTEYLGERPVLSAHKTRMYRVPANPGSQWHQDGAFLGGERTRTVNLWVPLTACGEDAPGLEIVPWRLEEIVPPGTHGSHFQWSVGEGKVAEMAGGRPMASPRFAPGDAMLFDHLCLHRTGVRPGMTRGRYALETWMFAPSSYPDTAPLII